MTIEPARRSTEEGSETTLDKRATAIYLYEIINQAGMAEIGTVSLQAALATLNHHVVPYTFQAAQSILTAAAQISKLLWMVNESDWSNDRRAFARDRARELRKITRPASLLSSRAVRNAIEHYDSRLDDQFFSSLDVHLVDQNVGSKRDIVVENSVFLRHLDPDSLVISVLDVGVSLPDLWAAVDAVQRRAADWLGANGFTVPDHLSRKPR